MEYNLPDKPGVYLFKNQPGEVIYVGKAVSLKNRVRSYFQGGRHLPPKIQVMVSRIGDLDYIVTGSEVEALILECSLIKQYKPRYNVTLKDDKQYPYLKLTLQEDYPRLFLTRRIDKDRARYFGPYTDAGSIKETLNYLKKIFPLRTCRGKFRVREGGRPCLNAHLGNCLAPCQGKVPREEYQGLIQDLVLFLEGRQEKVLGKMAREMEEAAEKLEFERAAALRDKYQALSRLVSRQNMVSPGLKDHDVIGLARGEKEACLQVFLIRQGKITGKEQFTLANTEELEEPEILTAFLKQYYSCSSFVPGEVIVPGEVQEKEVLEAWLGERRGGRVRFHLPRRGQKKEIVELVQQNARIFLLEKTGQEEKMRQRLENLAADLGLGQVPDRIEGFDVSNFQGKDTTASLVVFQGCLPAGKLYRRFKMDKMGGPDDYLALKEAVKRRLKAALREGEELDRHSLELKEAKFLPLPDLVLIDGGKGQLGAALEALEEVKTLIKLPGEDREQGRPLREGIAEGIEKISLVSLAKGEEKVFLPGKKEPLRLPPDSATLHLLQQVRDEAHRFALAYHRNLRDRGSVDSLLKRIPGLGEKRQKSLLVHLGSLEKIKKATREELREVPGIDGKMAETIYRYFNPQVEGV